MKIIFLVISLISIQSLRNKTNSTLLINSKNLNNITENSEPNIVTNITNYNRTVADNKRGPNETSYFHPVIYHSRTSIMTPKTVNDIIPNDNSISYDLEKRSKFDDNNI